MTAVSESLGGEIATPTGHSRRGLSYPSTLVWPKLFMFTVSNIPWYHDHFINICTLSFRVMGPKMKINNIKFGKIEKKTKKYYLKKKNDCGVRVFLELSNFSCSDKIFTSKISVSIWRLPQNSCTGILNKGGMDILIILYRPKVWTYIPI